MQGKNLVLGSPENGDIRTGGLLNDARTQRRNVFKRANEFESAHGKSFE